MTNPTTDTTTQATANDLKTFVSSAFDSYKHKLGKFAKVGANATLTDDDKSNQATIYIGEIASEIAANYVTTCAASGVPFADDGSLTYNIMMLLLQDGRVGKAIALPGGDWDALENLPQLADFNAFNIFLKTVKNRDALRREMQSCCC